MLDPVSLERMKPNHALIPKFSKPIRKDHLTEEHFLTWNSMMYGFSLNEKEWGGFSLDILTDVEWNDAIFDLLVLPEDQRMFVHDLVKAHGATSIDGKS